MRNNFFVGCVLCVLLAILLSCQETGVKKLATIQIVVKDEKLEVEVARTVQERSRGLMDRPSLGDHKGMLFVYERDSRMSFYMKNTFIPLSIAFISADGVILQIEDMKPLDESLIQSHFSVRYALEVNQGAFGRWGAGLGDRVIFPETFK